MYTKVVNDSMVKWLGDSWEPYRQEVPKRKRFALLRVPQDLAVSYRPGTRFGPDAILDAFNGFSDYCIDKRVSLAGVGLHDYGTIDVVNSLSSTAERIQVAVAGIDDGLTPVVLGGDHSISDPVYRGLLKKHPGKKIGIVVIDAHLDSRPPVSGKEHSGHWMYTISDVVDYRLVAQLGIVANIYSESYVQTAETNGVLIRTPYEMRRMGWNALLKELVQKFDLKCDYVYLSVDIDSLDHAFCAGTSVTNPCGLASWEVADLVYEIARALPVCCLDINEVSPILDRSGNTEQVGAVILMNYLAGTLKNEHVKNL